MRLLLFVAFLTAMVLLRACLAGQWRAGEQRARGLTGEGAGPAAGQAEP